MSTAPCSVRSTMSAGSPATVMKMSTVSLLPAKSGTGGSVHVWRQMVNQKPAACAMLKTSATTSTQNSATLSGRASKKSHFKYSSAANDDSTASSRHVRMYVARREASMPVTACLPRWWARARRRTAAPRRWSWSGRGCE